MADTWDKDLPTGTKAVALGDDVIRENNRAIETALDAEHDFTTGGTQSGRHHFLRDTVANADAISDWLTGAVYFNRNDLLTDLTLLQVASADGASNWEHVWPHNDWPELTQFHAWVAKTGTPLTWTGEEGHFFSTSLTANTTLNAPTFPTAGLAGRATTYTWRIAQHASLGPYTIAFSGNFRWLHGVTPVMPSGASEVLLLTLTRAPDDYLEGSWAVLA